MPKKTQPSTPTPAQTSDDEVLKKTMERFDVSWQYALGNWHNQWEDAWKLYNNKRVHHNYKGTAETFVPMVFGAIEAMVSALGNGRPTFDYESEYPSQDDNTDVLNTLVDNYWDRDQWDVKVVEILRQMLTTGTAPAYLYWDIDHPRLIHFAIRDAIVDPTLTSPEQLMNGCGYAGRRYLTTLDELKEFEVVDSDPKSKTYGEMQPRFQNLDKVTGDGQAAESAGGEVMDKALKDMYVGSTLTKPQGKQVEVIEVWDADRCVSIANRSVVIEDIVNPTKQLQIDRGDKNPRGIIPFIFFRDYTDVSQFYAKGEVEPIKQHQELLNDMTNQNLDAVSLQLSPQVELDPAFAAWQSKIDNKPGRVYPFKQGTIGWRAVPIVPQNAFNERTNIKNEIREATAIDQIAKGVQAPGDHTATEIKAQLNQAGQRVDLKAMNLEKDGFYQLGVILFRLIQLYVDKPTLVKVASATGTDLKVFDPAQFMGEYRPRVQLDITAKQTKAEQQQKAIQAYQMIIQDPTNNLQEAKKILYPRMLDLDPKEIEQIITPAGQGTPQGGTATEGVVPGSGGAPVDPSQAGAPQGATDVQGMPQPPTGAPAPGGAPQPTGDAGEQPEHPAVKLVDSLQIKFTDLPEDVKAQVIEQLFGITPTMPTPQQQQIDLKQAAQDHAGVVADNNTAMQVVKHVQAQQPQLNGQPQEVIQQ